MYRNIKKLTKRELTHDFSLSDVGGSTLTSEEVEYIMIANGCLFRRNFALKQGLKNPPHAILPNSQHTDFYFWHEALFHNARVTEILAYQLCRKLTTTKELLEMSPRNRRLSDLKDLYIIGPSYGSLFLVGAMATITSCWQGFTSKVVGKDQEWQSVPIPEGSRVQLVDDVIFSASAPSLMATRNAIKESLTGSRLVLSNEIGVIANASVVKKIDSFKIKSLITFPKPAVYEVNKCKLCNQGSKPYDIKFYRRELTEACWREPE